MRRPLTLDPRVTAESITAVLRPALDDDRLTVTEVRQEEVGEGRFNATILRLFLRYDPYAAGAPPAVIAKLPTSDPELAGRAPVFQPGAREQWFYRRAAPHTPDLVPRCYAAAIDAATHQSLLLLEDLGHFTARSWLEGATLPQAELALSTIARLHAYWWQAGSAPEIQELLGILSPQATDEQGLVQELFDSAWPRFVEQAPQALPERVRALGDAIFGNMTAVDALISQAPPTLVHGDFRLDNMRFGADDGAPICRLVDWEDVFFGSGLVDVSWFLGGCLDVAEGHHDQELLRHYHRSLMAEGVRDYPWERCYHDYRCGLCSSFVQGILSALKTSGASPSERELGQIIGERFVAAAERWRLLEMIVS